MNESVSDDAGDSVGVWKFDGNEISTCLDLPLNIIHDEFVAIHT